MYHPLTNIEIDKMLKGIDGVQKTISQGSLPKKIKPKEYRVINLDKPHNSGTHWTCYINDPKLSYILYFDSFGMVPPDRVVKYLKTSKKPIWYSRAPIQHIQSVMCGYYCVYIIREFASGRKIENILYDYDQMPTEENEKKIKQKFKKSP
jgi:hypothetical protein